ncbi:hypothetical protein ACFPN0_28235 [Kitasatospora cinereorecta]
MTIHARSATWPYAPLKGPGRPVDVASSRSPSTFTAPGIRLKGVARSARAGGTLALPGAGPPAPARAAPGLGRLAGNAPHTFRGRAPGRSSSVGLEPYSIAHGVPTGHRLAPVTGMRSPLRRSPSDRRTADLLRARNGPGTRPGTAA